MVKAEGGRKEKACRGQGEALRGLESESDTRGAQCDSPAPPGPLGSTRGEGPETGDENGQSPTEPHWLLPLTVMLRGQALAGAVDGHSLGFLHPQGKAREEPWFAEVSGAPWQAGSVGQ